MAEYGAIYVDGTILNTSFRKFHIMNSTLGSGYIDRVGTRQKLTINPKWRYFRNNLLYEIGLGTKNRDQKLTVFPKKRFIRCRYNRKRVYLFSTMTERQIAAKSALRHGYYGAKIAYIIRSSRNWVCLWAIRFPPVFQKKILKLVNGWPRNQLFRMTRS